MEPKILVIDIETAPASGYIWKLFDVNISLSQLIDTSKVICFAAKWYGEKKVIMQTSCEETTTQDANGQVSTIKTCRTMKTVTTSEEKD